MATAIASFAIAVLTAIGIQTYRRNKKAHRAGVDDSARGSARQNANETATDEARALAEQRGVETPARPSGTPGELDAGKTLAKAAGTP